MVEDNQAQTREKIHQRLLAETDDEVKKYRVKVRNSMLAVFVVVGLAIGVATAIWNNIGLSMLLGGIIFGTLGALILALVAMPSDKTILDIAGTYLNGNKYLVVELRKNRVLAQWGIFSIFVGYLLLSADIALRAFG